jgi:predicted secreted Zn-dependent protease
MSKMFAVFPLALVSLLSLPAVAEPLARMHASYYYIEGGSAAVLAGQMDKAGPVGPDGEHHPARTKWEVQWKFKREQQGVACVIGDAAVVVGVAQMFPKWRGEAKGPSALRSRWKQFEDALRSHEDRHKQHAIQAGKDIEAAIRSAKPAGNCEDLDTAANAAAEKIVEKYRKLDEDYDRKTRYGGTEGAALL